MTAGRLRRIGIAFIGLAVAMEGAAAHAQAGKKRSVTIHNATGDVVRGVHISPASQDYWGPDLSHDNIGIRQSRTFEIAGDGCLYDIRILLGDRPREQLLMKVDVCKTPTIHADGKTGTVVDRKG